MKHIFIVYALVGLMILAVLSVLSYQEGPGYIYILWHGIQIQTNLWFVSFFLLFVALSLHLLWFWVGKMRSREQRKIQQVTDFSRLHTYEKLGVLWVLEANTKQREYLQPVFENSGLLKEVIQSRIWLKQDRIDDALSVLQQSPADAFELAELQRIEIYLAQELPDQALTHLEFLHGHMLSPWLKDLEDAYQHKLNHLWGRFAIQYPWHYLKSTQYGHLDFEHKKKWLLKLLNDFDNASNTDLELIQIRYAQMSDQIVSSSYGIKSLWLKLISRIPEMAFDETQLSLSLLEERFDQDIFYLWFQQQLLKQNPDYEMLENQIDHFEMKYPGLPILSFSKWHIYTATHREQDAEALLQLYPDHPLMNYLRIKSVLKGDAVLTQQLNSVFETHNKFIQFKL